MSIDGGLRNIFKKYLPQVHWQGIELGGFGDGVPDTNGCYKGQDFWIEFKKEKSPGKIKWRPTQIGWIKDRVRHGGLVRIVIKYEHESVPQLTMFDGSALFEWEGNYNDFGSNMGRCLGIWIGGERDWNWNDILLTTITRLPGAEQLDVSGE